MPERVTVNNISSVTIIARAAKRNQIFIEVKDDGYPLRVFRRCLCPIGGNWIGQAARQDRNPLDTVRREINEELSLDKRTASMLELSLLGMKPEKNFYQTPSFDQPAEEAEIKVLNELKRVITESCAPFGDYLQIIPKEVLDRADPENKRDGFAGICSYWVVVLNEYDWEQLTALQKKFGNLSNESVTLFTSLEEIIETGVKTAFGHDRPLQQFFLCHGFSAARQFPLIEGISSQPIPTMASYTDYLEKYEILRKPI